MNDPFETPPELRDIEAMLEKAHPRGAGFDMEENRIAQDRIVFESGKVVGRQSSESSWWKSATAIMSGVAAVLLLMQFNTVITEQPSIEIAENVNLKTETSNKRERSNREALADTSTPRSNFAKLEFDNRSRVAYQDTDLEADEAYLSFLKLRSENVRRSTFNQEKDPS